MSSKASAVWMGRLGSTRLAAYLMLALACVAVGVLFFGLAPALPVSVVASALAANLLAALAVHPIFRTETALTVFHLCLVAVALLAALGQASRLQGQVEVAEGEDFRRELGAFEPGPLHRDHLDDVSFRNEGFTIDYAPGLKRGPTRNIVSWLGAAGRERREIGDQDPLILEGYRFYTTFNKGFAPVLEWTPAGGGPVRVGVLHLPGYPRNQLDQEGTVDLGPAGAAHATLIIEETVLDPAGATSFRIPAAHHLRVSLAGTTAELRPGEAMDLPNGRLVYVALRTWMGYHVFYDWTLPWMLAAACGAVASLLVHLLGTFRAPLTDGAIHGA